MTSKRTTKAAEAPAAPTPFVFTASLADQVRAQRDKVHDFSLDATMPGSIAKVRLPDLGDPDVLMGLPSPLLEKIMRYTQDVEKAEGKELPAPIDLASVGEFDIERVRKDAERNRALIDAYCLAGFVNPPLAFTEDDLTTPEHVLLSVIHPSDRMRFFQWSIGQHTEAAATVEPFPDRPGTDVAVGGSGGVDRAASERSAQVA